MPSPIKASNQKSSCYEIIHTSSRPPVSRLRGQISIRLDGWPAALGYILLGGKAYFLLTTVSVINNEYNPLQFSSPLQFLNWIYSYWSLLIKIQFLWRKTVYIYLYYAVLKMHCVWDIYTQDSVGSFKCFFFHLFFKGTLRYSIHFQACYAPVPAALETSI